MPKLQPVKFKSDQMIFEVDSTSDEVFFLLNGGIKHIQTGRILPEGAMFGETDVVMKRRRHESFISREESFALKFEAHIFTQCLEAFEDMKEEVMELVQKREEARLKHHVKMNLGDGGSLAQQMKERKQSRLREIQKLQPSGDLPSAELPPIEEHD